MNEGLILVLHFCVCRALVTLAERYHTMTVQTKRRNPQLIVSISDCRHFGISELRQCGMSSIRKWRHDANPTFYNSDCRRFGNAEMTTCG